MQNIIYYHMNNQIAKGRWSRSFFILQYQVKRQNWDLSTPLKRIFSNFSKYNNWRFSSMFDRIKKIAITIRTADRTK